MNKRRRDKIYFRKAPEGEHSRMPMPTDGSAVKINFSHRTYLFLGWTAIKWEKNQEVKIFCYIIENLLLLMYNNKHKYFYKYERGVIIYEKNT